MYFGKFRPHQTEADGVVANCVDYHHDTYCLLRAYFKCQAANIVLSIVLKCLIGFWPHNKI